MIFFFLFVVVLFFLFFVLVMYGGLPTVLAFYSAFNVVANLALLRLLDDLQTRPPDAAAVEQRERLWANILVLLLCIPGAFVLQGTGRGSCCY